MPLIFWGVLPRCGSATALIGVVSQAAPVELGFRLASLRRVYL